VSVLCRVLLASVLFAPYYPAASLAELCEAEEVKLLADAAADVPTGRLVSTGREAAALAAPCVAAGAAAAGVVVGPAAPPLYSAVSISAKNRTWMACVALPSPPSVSGGNVYGF
jgi:hypothetical protein